MASNERLTREADIDAFFALPRHVLYLGGLACLVMFFGGGAAAFWLSDAIGGWVLPMSTGAVAALIAVLRRAPSGRGLLWSFNKWQLSPTAQLRFWICFSLVLALALTVLTVVSKR